MRKLANCQHEPPYPGAETILFSLRDPNLTMHAPTFRCATEHPHPLEQCGEVAPMTLARDRV